MVSSLLSRLECFNDPNFKFDPIRHRYTYGDRQYTSVTTFIKNFESEFQEDYWSKVKADERGITQEEILKEWKDKNDYAKYVGSETHQWIENYFNGVYQKLPSNVDIVDRINKFNISYAKDLHKLTPLKFEIRIFSKKYPLAGTIDSLFLFKDKLIIFDWKSNGKFTHDDHPDGKYESLLHPFSDQFKNHLNSYSIQVSLYSLILEEWGFDVRACYLLHVGQSDDAKIYKSKDYTSILRDYLDGFSWI